MKTANWPYALLSLALAVVAWYFVSGREKVELWMECSVQYASMPEGIVVRSGLLGKLDVRVRAPRGLVRRLEEQKLTYGVDLSRLKEGRNVIAIEAENLPLARSFEVVELSPTRLELVADKISFKDVPVKPVARNGLDAALKLVDMAVTPRTVRVTGPQSALKDLMQIETQPVPLPFTGPGQAEAAVALHLPEELRADPGTVTVSVVVTAKMKIVSFQLGVDVENRSRYAARVRPAKVEVAIEAPVSVYKESGLKDKLSASIFLGAEAKPGVYNLVPDIALFSGAKLVKITPETVEVTIKEQKPGG